MEKHSIKVSILSKNFSLRTDEDKNKIIAASQKVDVMLKKMIEQIPTLPEANAAMMVCIQLAVDEQNLRELIQSFQITAEDITTQIDQALTIR